jgi:hypothetical protein
MKIKFNSYTNELTAESNSEPDWEVFRMLKSYFFNQAIEASLPWVEYNPSIKKLLLKFDDTRFKIYNNELQTNLLKDCIDIFALYGYVTEPGYQLEIDKDFLIQGEYNKFVKSSFYPWPTRTDSYPQLFSVPNHIEYHQEFTQEYLVKLIGLWNNEDIQKLISTMRPQLASQCTIKGTEFKKVIVVAETNVEQKQTFLDLQIFVIDKVLTTFDEFGDYRFYQIQ